MRAAGSGEKPLFIEIPGGGGVIQSSFRRSKKGKPAPEAEQKSLELKYDGQQSGKGASAFAAGFSASIDFSCAPDAETIKLCTEFVCWEQGHPGFLLPEGVVIGCAYKPEKKNPNSIGKAWLYCTICEELCGDWKLNGPFRGIR